MFTLLIDDEPLALKLLTSYVDRHPELTLAGSYLNPIDALDYLRTNTVDLVLLDVQMPELNGLHVARLLREKTAVILTTAYEEHALAGFELDVIDYLLKPVSYQRFERAVAKVRPTSPPSNTLLQGRAAGENEDDPKFASETVPFFVKSGHRTLRLDLDNLQYVSSAGDYLELYLADGSKILILESLTYFAARLPEHRFCRIHRSHLVALDKINFVERRRVVIGDKWLPVSEGYRQAFEERLKY